MVSNLYSDRNPSSRGSVDMTQLEYRDKEYLYLHLGTYLYDLCQKGQIHYSPLLCVSISLLFGEDTFDRDDVRRSQRHSV